MSAKWQVYGLSLISLALYVLMGYFFERHDIGLLITYTILFALYFYAYQKIKDEQINFWLSAGMFFRLVLLFSLPALSDDFYRFIWDGRLLHVGLHPFSQLPSFYIENNIDINGIDATLYENLNSKNYFTVYPPLAQLVFWFSALISPNSIIGSVLVIRVLILCAELGSILLMTKLLRHFNIASKNILLYALNPLAIIELTGNLHFEAFVIYFLLLSIYWLIKEKLILSALAFAFAISIKLLPLIFLPYIVWRLRWKKGIIYTLIALLTTAITFIPLLNADIVSGFQESIGYYFQKFEFNASIYYLVREWGFWKYDYNIIQTVGWKLGLISAALIIVISIFKSPRLTVHSPQSVTQIKQRTVDLRLWTQFTFILLTYLLFTTTVHPWYITPLIAFSVFVHFRFAMVWSFLIFMTYAGYSKNDFQEIIWITALQYIIVLGYLAYELYRHEKRNADHILSQS